MGYTHYWTFRKPLKGKTQIVEKLYQRALRDCQRTIKAYYSINGGLSGYSAHTVVGLYGGLYVNGKGDNMHEPFILREHYTENINFNFCKTAQKPYDTVVVACLAILKHHLKDLIVVSSDGDSDDWKKGVNLGRLVLKKKLTTPLQIRGN